MALDRAATREPTIEEIEAEIRQAKFQDGPADQLMAARAKSAMMRERSRDMKDKRLVSAYLAGYRTGQKAGDVKPIMYAVMVFVICVTAIKLLPALFS